jgi:hypothetical protein
MLGLSEPRSFCFILLTIAKITGVQYHDQLVAEMEFHELLPILDLNLHSPDLNLPSS